MKQYQNLSDAMEELRRLLPESAELIDSLQNNLNNTFLGDDLQRATHALRYYAARLLWDVKFKQLREVQQLANASFAKYLDTRCESDRDDYRNLDAHASAISGELIQISLLH